MNKMGFNVKMGGDGLLYTILVVVLFLYIFNMNDIYQLISKAKNGELFKGEAKEEEVLPNDNEKEEEQYNAVKQALNNKFSIIYGGAGTGKSTIIKTMVESIIKTSGTENNLILCAPTGK